MNFGVSDRTFSSVQMFRSAAALVLLALALSTAEVSLV